jgi:hypothetical protein
LLKNLSDHRGHSSATATVGYVRKSVRSWNPVGVMVKIERRDLDRSAGYRVPYAMSGKRRISPRRPRGRRRHPATASAPFRSLPASMSPFMCWATWTRSSFSHGHISGSTLGGVSRRARPPVSSKTRRTFASCRTIGLACSSSFRISRLGCVRSLWRMASARRSLIDSWSAARSSVRSSQR